MLRKSQLKESTFFNGIHEHSFRGMGVSKEGVDSLSRIANSRLGVLRDFSPNYFEYRLRTKHRTTTPPPPPLSIQLFERRGDGTCRNPARLLVETLGRDWWEGEQMWAAVAVF